MVQLDGFVMSVIRYDEQLLAPWALYNLHLHIDIIERLFFDPVDGLEKVIECFMKEESKISSNGCTTCVLHRDKATRFGDECFLEED